MLFEDSAADAALARISREKIGTGSGKGHQASCPGWDDSDIDATAAVLLDWRNVDPGYAVLIKVDKGWVTLSGHVDRPFKKDAVEHDVRRLLGVVGVTNAIEVRVDAAALGRSDPIPHDARPDTEHNLARAPE